MNNLKHKIDRAIGKSLVLVETLIAIFTAVVLVILLGIQVYDLVCHPEHLLTDGAVGHYLHEILSIVIGLEFVKLLLHLTPANILEVLTMALARGIIVDHGSAVDNLLSIVCIVALFAARRYLIPKSELYQEMDDSGHQNSHHGRRHGKHGHEKEEQKTH